MQKKRKRSSLLTNPTADHSTKRYGSVAIQDGSESSNSLLSSSDSSSQKTSTYSCGTCVCCDPVLMRLRCKRICKRRPKGKAVFLVFFIYFLESVAFYGALDGIKHLIVGHHKAGNLTNFIFVLFYSCAGRIFYPLAGLLADSWLGRYNVMHIGLWLLWLGFAISTVTLSLDVLPHVIEVFTRYILPVIAAILLSAGAGSVELTCITFGVDQITQGASSEELSSYFYWLYFIRNAGLITGMCVYLAIFETSVSFLPSNLDKSSSAVRTFNITTFTTIQALIALCAITIALLLHVCLKHWYFRDRERENPLKLVINVLYFAATVKRQLPRYRRAFRFGEAKKPRIELAKIDYDGIFSAAEVEDVKTFCRILLLLYSLGGFFMLYGAVFAMLSSQFTTVAHKVFEHHSRGHYVQSILVSLLEDGIILIYVPLMNHFLHPFFPNVSMRLRMGTGVALAGLSSLLGAVLEWTFQDLPAEKKLLLLSLPLALFALGEVLVILTGQEFIYAQSPDSMKGLLIGILYLSHGIASGAGSIVYYQYPTQVDLFNVNAWFYIIFFFIGTLGLFSYTLVACLYRNRERPTADDSEGEALRRIYATAVYS